MGIPIKQGVDVATVNFMGLLAEVMKKKFDGYLCICVQGRGGMEEGTLVFEDGRIVASMYEYFRYNKILMGEQAFARVLNASAAKHGIIEIYQLTAEQVQLILAFNEQAIFVPVERDLRNVNINEFSIAYEERVQEEKKESKDTKENLLKKYKIEEAGGKPDEERDMSQVY